MAKSGNQKKKDSNKIGAVMVVGSGICGMQSALDLANSGFKVYLVEETTSIGGRMVQLDKTFPTNDCSMCIISPKLIEVDKHLNIEILSGSQVQSLEGEAGNFTVKVLKKPRYIDIEKCSSCGDCFEACPVDLINEFEQGLNTRKAINKRYPQAVPSAVAISKAARPPCKLTCPAGCNGQGRGATGRGMSPLFPRANTSRPSTTSSSGFRCRRCWEESATTPASRSATATRLTSRWPSPR